MSYLIHPLIQPCTLNAQCNGGVIEFGDGQLDIPEQQIIFLAYRTFWRMKNGRTDKNVPRGLRRPKNSENADNLYNTDNLNK